MKTGAICSSETLATTQDYGQHNPEERNPHFHSGENLKPKNNAGFPWNKQKGGGSQKRMLNSKGIRRYPCSKGNKRFCG
jgi:hypothetical protein